MLDVCAVVDEPLLLLLLLLALLVLFVLFGLFVLRLIWPRGMPKQSGSSLYRPGAAAVCGVTVSPT